MARVIWTGPRRGSAPRSGFLTKLQSHPDLAFRLEKAGDVWTATIDGSRSGWPFPLEGYGQTVDEALRSLLKSYREYLREGRDRLAFLGFQDRAALGHKARELQEERLSY